MDYHIVMMMIMIILSFITVLLFPPLANCAKDTNHELRKIWNHRRIARSSFVYQDFDNNNRGGDERNHRPIPSASRFSAPVEVFARITAPPKITILSHTLASDTVDIESGSRIHLRCTGQRPMIWIFPNNYITQFESAAEFALSSFGGQDDLRSANVTSNCDQRVESSSLIAARCWTEAILLDVQYDMTGNYVCQYAATSKNGGKQSSNNGHYDQDHATNQSSPWNAIINSAHQSSSSSSSSSYRSDQSSFPSLAGPGGSEQSSFMRTNIAISDSIYIFVNDPHHLMVPFEGQSHFLFIALFQQMPATIPCRATSSRAIVRLFKMRSTGGGSGGNDGGDGGKAGNAKSSEELEEIRPNATLGITFNAKKGFYFENARWDADSNSLQCHFELDDRTETMSISIHWSILPQDLHPIIDDSNARHIFENDTFSLRCFVHIDIGVIIVADWDYPNKNDTSRRIAKSHIKTQQITVNGNSYHTVSLNITVANTTLADQGDYRCNVNDGNGRIFSAVKRINVLDKHLPAAINFTVMPEFDNTKPLIHDKDDDVRFVTYVNAFPDVSWFNLVWLKDGNPLELNTTHYQIQIFSDSVTQISFYIPKAKSSDSGVYTLIGNTSTVSANISFTVYVSGEPELIIDGLAPFYRANQSYEILCKSYSHPTGAVWWSWMPCDDDATDDANQTSNFFTSGSVSACFDDSPDRDREIYRSQADARWRNVTQSSIFADERDGSNYAVVIHEMIREDEKQFLNISKLRIGRAARAGIYRCSAINRYSAEPVHQQTRFVVMDGDETFLVTSSTNEPTINETILLTCKASVIDYDQIRWSTSLPEHEKYIKSAIANEYSLTSTILLRSVQSNDSAMFVCAAKRRYSAQIEKKEIHLVVKNVSSPIIMETNMNDEVIEKENSSKFEFRCYIAGRPTPSLQWYRNRRRLFPNSHDSGIRAEDRGQRLVFTRLLDKDSGLYECRAHNRGGAVTRKAYLRITGGGSAETLQSAELLLIAFLALIGASMLTMACFVRKKIRDEKLQKRDLEFFSKTIFENGQMELFNPEMPLDEQIDLLPYDSRYEFPKDRLELGPTLGQGAFGRVVKGKAIGLESDDCATTVAVKMLKERADANQRKALMAELKILIHLGRHLNIVNLLGAVTKNIAKGELLVIVEYCEYGNLRHFLYSNRESFINELCANFDEQQRSPTTSTPTQSTDYQNVRCVSGGANQSRISGKIGRSLSTSPKTPDSPQRFFPPNSNTTYINTDPNGNAIAATTTPASSPKSASVAFAFPPSLVPSASSQLAYYNHNYVSGVGVGDSGNRSGSFSYSTATFSGLRRQRSNPPIRVSTSELICFSFQCARGMEYLTSRKLIHRDLAARNVLLASNNVVKICDFGLAKDVYKYDNYVKKDNGPLPIKWMAIESISDKIFTSKSDVWSFGILLWEIFTLGKNPYPGVEIDEKFYKRLKAGYRMEKPEFASDRIYALMTRCWDANPNERPDFGEIVANIGGLMDDKIRQHYIDLNNPYSEMNQQIFISRTDEYLKMSSVCGDDDDCGGAYGYAGQEYLKMESERGDDELLDQVLAETNNNIPNNNFNINNNSTIIRSAANPSLSTKTIAIDEMENPQMKMIEMQNFAHHNHHRGSKSESQEASILQQSSMVDNSAAMIVSSQINNYNNSNDVEHHNHVMVTSTNIDCGHHHNHHKCHHTIQQTVL